MNRRFTPRARQASRLRTAALMLVLGTGFAAAGQAETMPQLVVTAQKAPNGPSAETLRNTMQAKAQRAVRATRVSVAADLGVRLNSQHREFRIAANGPGKRG